MAAAVHPTAEVAASAQLGDNVTVAAGALVEEGCIIGDGTVIGRNSIVWAGTVIGRNNRIFPFCSLGGEPQDKKFQGEKAPLIIGDDNTIREYCFINQGTAAGNETRIGDRNLLMAYAHIAHDCVIGSDTIIANTVQIAGHVTVDDYAILSGGVLVHQFRRIGESAIIGGGEPVWHDVPPFAKFWRGSITHNQVGLERRQFSADDIAGVKSAYRLLYRRELNLAEAATQIEQTLPLSPLLKTLVAFCRLPDIKLVRPRHKSNGSDE